LILGSQLVFTNAELNWREQGDALFQLHLNSKSAAAIWHPRALLA
jgi:hypothetical protein